MYWAHKGNIFRILKNSLHESLFLAPIIILIALFCNLNTHLLLAEFPQKIKSQDITERKKKHTIPFLMHHLINTI